MPTRWGEGRAYPALDPPAPYQGLGRASPSQRGLCSPGRCTPAAGFSMAMGTLGTLLVLGALFFLPAEAQQGRSPTVGVGRGGVLGMSSPHPLRRGDRQKREGARPLLEPLPRSSPGPAALRSDPSLTPRPSPRPTRLSSLGSLLPVPCGGGHTLARL